MTVDSDKVALTYLGQVILSSESGFVHEGVSRDSL